MAMKEGIETRNMAEMAQSENQQAGKNVAVTREMIEAGVEILMRFEWGWSDPSAYAADIYRTMASAVPSAVPQDGK